MTFAFEARKEEPSPERGTAVEFKISAQIAIVLLGSLARVVVASSLVVVGVRVRRSSVFSLFSCEKIDPTLVDGGGL